MKRRKGFVSNSSSSSFILEFPGKITSKEQLKQYLDFDAIQGKSYIGHAEILDVLFRDIQEEMEKTVDLRNIDRWALDELMENYNIELMDLRFKSIEDILKEKCSSNRVRITYSDDCSYWSEFEHRIVPNIFGKYLIEHISGH